MSDVLLITIIGVFGIIGWGLLLYSRMKSGDNDE
jgi:hypothetical protein